VNAIGLGDVVLATVPSEMFLEQIEAIRRPRAAGHLLLIGFSASGSLGYIGTPLAYEQGGYETGGGPLPSPGDGQQDGRPRSRLIRSRIDTGLEIVRETRAIVARLADGKQ
jgi:hypothetical protein